MTKILMTLTLVLLLGLNTEVKAQTAEEVAQMKVEMAAKAAEAAKIKAELDAVNGEIAKLKSAIDKTIKWRFGSGGLLGFDINNFNNWAPKPDLNSSAQSISFNYNGFANLIQEKYFWRSNGGVNLGWQKYDENSQATGDNDGFNQVADVLFLQSLFGYNFSKEIASSALGEYRSTLLSNFNNPGFLDFGVGITYTPNSKFFMVLHPLNYNFIFAEDQTDYDSSLGAKLVADYNTKLYDLISWRSNLSAFLSYDTFEQSNYTWVNSFNFVAFKGIGIGFELGLRWNPQETLARDLASDNQSYYQLGISYAIQ